MVMGLLSPTLSSERGEGEPLARCSPPPDACKVQQLAGAVVRRGAVRKREQAPRTPNASRSSVAALARCGHRVSAVERGSVQLHGYVLDVSSNAPPPTPVGSSLPFRSRHQSPPPPP